MDTTLYFMDRLRVIRAIHNLSVTECAKKLGVSKQCVSKLENSELKPSVTLVHGIESIFKLPYGFFSSKRMIMEINGKTSRIKYIVQ